eukprot:CAMPEP_0118845256 /NCGR_PEP_ID=MMETSP1162-20130426/88634_1 /TAXON_ID=33656 /ORGANISM="Phaeocystis Sp, Strain CCMP2710" /LENGTH=96 /DNA_ID=CAMNT_0006777403 /DNA_START=48 /DNA_END=335 /DNA_ORIENTATION=+
MVVQVERLDVARERRVGERGARGLVWLPHVRQLDGEAHVLHDDPVVREVTVDNLAHRVRLLLEHLRHEVEQHVEHARLRRQRDRAVLRQRVRRDLA